MKGLGYLAHKTAICEGCGKRLPTASDPTIVWGHSLDGLAYAAYCEPCVKKLRVKVVDRVVAGSEWCPPPPPQFCGDCGRPLPAPDDGGWILWALTADGIACFCNDCRVKRGLPTATTSRLDSRGKPAPADERPREDGHGASLLVGVLSDTHGRLDSAIVDLFADCDHIVHAGDVGDRAVLERLRKLAPVTAVRGNCDGGDLAGLPESATTTLGDVTLLVRHDLVMVEALDTAALAAMQAAGRGVVVSGHTHLPAIERRDGVLYLNPGSASLRRYEMRRSVALLHIEREKCAAEIHELGRDVLL